MSPRAARLVLLSLAVGACRTSGLSAADAAAGSPDGLAPDASVADTSMATPEDASAPADQRPDVDPTGGNALGKLCHELNRSGMPVTLTLELGDPTAVRIMAVTGRCAPPAGTPCATIPAGQVPIRLLEGDKLLTSRQVVLRAGGEYVFQPIIATNLQVEITGGAIAAGTCQGLDFPPPDGGQD